MHQLMRRVAMGLTLPLVVGAPVLLIAGPAAAATPTVLAVPNANPSVYGQEIHVVATVFNGEQTNPVSAGSIQFVVDGFEQGPPVHLDSAGHATSPALVDEGGLPLDITVGSDFYSVSAEFIPDEGSGFDPPMPTFYQQRVNQSGTSIAVLPTATTLVADMAGALPGGVQLHSEKPTGAVEFRVNGAVVGSNDIVNGRATLNYVLPAGNQTVKATYGGDDRYGPATESLTRADPTLEARVFSRFPPSKSGWYNSTVRIWFFCKPRGSELVEGCPGDVSLKESGKDQGLTRAVHAVDGGSATATVSGIDIDRDAPDITVKGRSCTATDKLSGVKGKCHLKIEPNGHYRAIAKDKAGNRAVVRGVLD